MLFLFRFIWYTMKPLLTYIINASVQRTQTVVFSFRPEIVKKMLINYFSHSILSYPSFADSLYNTYQVCFFMPSLTPSLLVPSELLPSHLVLFSLVEQLLPMFLQVHCPPPPFTSIKSISLFAP